MATTVPIGSAPLTIQDLRAVSRDRLAADWAPGAVDRINKGRAALTALLESGERLYGVNTGVGGNIKFELSPEDAESLQHNLLRHLSCATGQPLRDDVVRGAMLLRLANFATGCSGVRVELCNALLDLLNTGVTPVVPRYGSVGASGDLMPSAYVARVLIGMGEAVFKGEQVAAVKALEAAGLTPITLAAKEGLALINGTTVMTSAAALVLLDAQCVLQAVLRVITLAVEAIEVPVEPFEAFVHDTKGHPGQIAVAAFMRDQFRGTGLNVDQGRQSCYTLRCGPQGLGPAWEAFDQSRVTIEREMNSANDNPLVDPETGRLYRAGNFYGGHIARALDSWKIDFAIMGNWINSLIAVLVDVRFNNGLPANLVTKPGVNSGMKGLQLSVTSLACAVRQMAGPSSIHSVPTEEYNQDVVSLGMHAAVTAMDALECLKNQVAMALIAVVQAVDLRGCVERLGEGNRFTYQAIRRLSAFLERDRPLESDVSAVAQWLTTLAAQELRPRD